MICENVAGASRSSPLIGRLAQKQNARGETPPQRPGARRASHVPIMGKSTNPHAWQYNRSEIILFDGSGTLLSPQIDSDGDVGNFVFHSGSKWITASTS